jgi:hypothetical protein
VSNGREGTKLELGGNGLRVVDALGEACCSSGKVKGHGFEEGGTESMGTNWWSEEALLFSQRLSVKESEGVLEAGGLGWGQSVSRGVGCW